MLLTKVVFCVSLTWYAQKLSPDSQTNKMHEAIKVICIFNKIEKKTVLHFYNQFFYTHVGY